jgi:hypothetical protein
MTEREYCEQVAREIAEVMLTIWVTEPTRLVGVVGVTHIIERVRAAARAEGREQGLEEAVSAAGYSGAYCFVVDAIRALKAKP